MKKRIISLGLTLAIMATMLFIVAIPVNAIITTPVYSRAELATAINNSPTDGTLHTIVLMSDISGTGGLVIPAGANVRLQSEYGERFTFTRTNNSRHFVVDGTLQILDLILDGGGQTGTASGGVHVRNGAEVFINQSIIRNGHHGVATDGASFTLTIGGSEIINNSQHGLAITAPSAANATTATSSITIAASRIANNAGRGISALGHLTNRAQRPVHLHDVIIENNGGDGGIFNQRTNVYLNGETIIRNNLRRGIWAYNDSLVTINNATISGNLWGGIRLGNGGQVVMNNGLITQNNDYETIGGGGVHVGGNASGSARGSVFTMNNGIISYNTAEFGGGIMVGGGNGGQAEAIINGGQIINNSAVRGGGIYLRSVNMRTGPGALLPAIVPTVLEIGNAIISGNTAQISGGGIYAGDSEIILPIITNASHTLAMNTFANGLAPARFNLNGTTITNNTAQNGYGGGIYMGTHELTVRARPNATTAYTTRDVTINSTVISAGATTITNNHAALDGGGIFAAQHSYTILLPANAYPQLTFPAATIFSGNSAGNGAFRQPINPQNTRVSTDITSTSTFSHPLNNYDINFRATDYITVDFDLNGQTGTAPDDQRLPRDPNLTAFEPPTPNDRNGYTFTGWFTDPDGQNRWDFDTPVTDDMTLYAGWEADITVTFNLNGAPGTPPANQVLPYAPERRATEPATNPQWDGHTFMGWYTESENINRWDFDTTIYADLELFARWEPDITVTFNLNGAPGTPPTDQVIPYAPERRATEPATNPQWDGHTFMGWYTAATGGTAWDFDTTIYADLELFARWEPIIPTFTITYDGNGNTAGNAPIDANDYEEGYVVVILGYADLIRDGYSFIGWNTAADGSGQTYQPDDEFIMPNHNVTLYAMWEAIDDPYVPTPPIDEPDDDDGEIGEDNDEIDEDSPANDEPPAVEQPPSNDDSPITSDDFSSVIFAVLLISFITAAMTTMLKSIAKLRKNQH